MLQVDLKIEKQKLLFQEDTECTVTLKNGGSKNISVPDPSLEHFLPVFRVLNRASGAEKQYRGEKPSGAIIHPPEDMIPGQTEEEDYSLLDRVKELPPGTHEISVSWVWDGSEESVSPAVPVEVAPTTPKGLTMANASAGNGSLKYGAWVNMAADPPALVRSAFQLLAGAQIFDIVPGPKISPRADLAISCPGTMGILESQWIAWLEDGFLRYLHVDERQGLSKVQELKLPVGEVRLAKPLFSSPLTDPSIRPAGAALVCFGMPGGTQFRAQTLELTTDKPKPVGAGNAKGKIPDWITGHPRRLDEWVATWIQAGDQSFRLSRGNWPGLKNAELDPLELAEWKGKFLGAAATLGPDLDVFGAALYWEFPAPDEKKLVLQPWSLSIRNEFEQGEPHEIPWPPNDFIAATRVAVSDEGLPCAMIRNIDAEWQVYNGKKLGPAPVQYLKSDLPLEMGFLEGSKDLVFIAGAIAGGFQIVDKMGKPIPPRSKK